MVQIGDRTAQWIFPEKIHLLRCQKLHSIPENVLKVNRGTIKKDLRSAEGYFDPPQHKSGNPLSAIVGA
jgi:hypothetical protein